MIMTQKTTGPISAKLYECQRCGAQSTISTNHWGETYGRCDKCQWKYPMQMGSVHKCLEPVPEGYGVPEPWTQVKLGDIAEIVSGSQLKRLAVQKGKP